MRVGNGLTTAILALLLLVAAGVGAQTTSEGLSECSAGYGAPPDIRISECTELIDAGRLNSGQLSIALSNRGWAHNDKGEFDTAIQDLDRAVQLDPNNAY